ncbi:RL27 [Hepatospora eriocheir]|uniref:RL27 n=1 Tax=Hepatospora eriocheir TaxID=1081669 RepID=A0A1X0QIV7_9MICR|nr:RL27 [Hepatospora eriocheir]
MLFKQNMIVVINKGRHASRKAVILKVTEDRLLLGGISKIPTKVEDHMSAAEKRKAVKLLTFIKNMNISHVTPTRYVSELDFSKIPVDEVVNNVVSRTNAKEIMTKVFEDAFNNEKEKPVNKFLFSTLVISK